MSTTNPFKTWIQRSQARLIGSESPFEPVSGPVSAESSFGKDWGYPDTSRCSWRVLCGRTRRFERVDVLQCLAIREVTAGGCCGGVSFVSVQSVFCWRGQPVAVFRGTRLRVYDVDPV